GAAGAGGAVVVGEGGSVATRLGFVGEAPAVIGGGVAGEARAGVERQARPVPVHDGAAVLGRVGARAARERTLAHGGGREAGNERVVEDGAAVLAGGVAGKAAVVLDGERPLVPDRSPTVVGVAGAGGVVRGECAGR